MPLCRLSFWRMSWRRNNLGSGGSIKSKPPLFKFAAGISDQMKNIILNELGHVFLSQFSILSCSHNFLSRLVVTIFLVSYCHNFLSHLVVTIFHDVLLSQFSIMSCCLNFPSCLVVTIFCHILLSQFSIMSCCHIFCLN